VAALSDPRLSHGWIERGLAEEYPDLRLVSVTVPAPRARRSRGLRERLELHADRFHGARAVTMRREPIPAAYRVFFRHVGIDPDVERTPIEAAVLQRLVEGGFRSRGTLEDALLLALLETGVPVWGLDDDALDGLLGARAAHAGERLGEGPYADDLAPGRLVVADERVPVALLFGEVAPSCLPGRGTANVRLFAIAVPGVPALHVEEALFGCADALSEAQ
jgi:DNA/RNA-binding domain of Phe-tRNA-synthetase-like protein